MIIESSKPTSAQALNALTNNHIKQLQDLIADIVVAAARNGIDDLSGREIQQRFELIHGKRIETGSVSSRVNALMAAGRLEHGPERPCRVTGRNILPVRPVVTQVRMVA